MTALDDRGAVDLLHAMVRTPSLSCHEGAVARLLVDTMREHGFRARIDEAGNAVGEIGLGPRTVALVGHMDTVPGDLPVILADGILHGRGAVDAKGPLASFVVAASRLAASGESLRLVVVGCVEEEAPSSLGARHLAETLAPDALVIGEPSGWNGITLGYKGYLRTRVTLSGPNAHTAHDEETLPDRATALWRRVKGQLALFNADRPRVFDRLLGALLDMDCQNDGAWARVTLDFALRLPPDLDPADALAKVTRLAGDAEVEVMAEPMHAWSGPRTSPLARSFARAILAQNGSPRFQVKTGTADLNILAPRWNVPALAYGPGDAALDHTPEEHIHVDEYLRSIDVLVHGLRDWNAAPLGKDDEPARERPLTPRQA